MTTKQAKDVLRHPDRLFVLTALSFVNLTDKEVETLILRHLRGHTQEETGRELMAEELRRNGKKNDTEDEYTVRCVQTLEKSALLKCCAVWENLSFVRYALDSKG